MPKLTSGAEPRRANAYVALRIAAVILVAVLASRMSGGVLHSLSVVALLGSFWYDGGRTRTLLRRVRWLLLAVLITSAWLVPGASLWPEIFFGALSAEGAVLGIDAAARVCFIIAAIAILLDMRNPDALVSGVYGLAQALLPWAGAKNETFALRLGLTLNFATGASAVPARLTVCRPRPTEIALVRFVAAASLIVLVM